MATFTVGKLAKRFGLSRSTLLYYDSIGLLTPQGRADGEYRRYGEEEMERLRRICLYRKAGLSLADIKLALDKGSELSRTLEARLLHLNQEISGLREQQRLILKILGNKELERTVDMSRARWTALLKASGFTEEDMVRWHVAFERHAPEEHQAFLKFLCIPEEEIQVIRGWGEGLANKGIDQPTSFG